MKKLIRFCLAVQVLVWTSQPTRGTQPDHWTVSTPEEFLAGELKGVSVTGEGGIVLAPALEPLFETKEAFVHAVAADPAGNIYLATGNQGKIFRVGANAQGAEWAKLGEAGVHALAVDSSSRLYAASAPDGKVYRFENGPTPQAFFDPDDKYIWALAIDNQNNVYVGTGPKGIIYKVNPQGKSEVFYDSKETHIITLELTPDGRLLAGTAPGGLVFRFSPEGKPFVLYDSSMSEIKALATDRYGNIYAAGLSGGPSLDTSPETPDTTAKPKASVTASPKGDSDAETVQIGGDAKGPKKTEIYKIDKSNAVEVVYTSNDGLPYDLAVRPDGNLLLATSNKGRIVAIDPRRFPTYLAQTTEEQVTQLLERGGKVYAATSNLGKLFLIGGKSTGVATYESKVFDAGMTATWGAIRWRSKGSATVPDVRIFTRSGNTSTADQTWTDWDGPYPDGGSAQVKSPSARFLQWKVEFPEKSGPISPGQSDGIDMVTVAYLQQNLAPQLSTVTVHAPGVAFVEFPGANTGGGVSPGGPDRSHLLSLPRSVREIDKGSAGSVPARKIYYPGARSLSWSASDANQDDLVYSVSIRRQGENNWLLLKDDLTDTHYTLDGSSLPSGTYFAKVTASDRMSNPPRQALESQLFSKAFVLANDLPSVQIAPVQVQNRAATVQFTCKSTASTIHQAEYSVDGRQWSIVFPADGIADTESEQYSVKLDNLAAGEHHLLVRVTDSVGNVSTGTTRLTVQ